MSELSEHLKERTMRFAVSVLRLVDKLPRTSSANVVGRQLADAATSVAANYRGSCNAPVLRESIELHNIFAKSVGTARANVRFAPVRQREAN